MKKALPIISLLAASLVSIVACEQEKEEKKGESLNAPAIEPPVAEATPGALKITSTALSLSEVTESTACDDGDTTCFRERAMARLVTRIFSGREGCRGEADEQMQGRVRCNLEKIDSRLAELDRRAVDSPPRKCVAESAKDHVIAMPGGVTLTAKLQCGDDLGEFQGTQQYLGFGFDAGVFHVVEVQDSGRVHYGSVNQDTGDIEFVMGGKKTISTSVQADTGDLTPGNDVNNGKYALDMIHIKANQNNTSFEISVGANYAMGTGVGCGVRLKSNGTHIYVNGKLAEPTSNTLETDCALSDKNVDQSVLDTCLDAETLEPTDDANCAELTTFTVGNITPATFEQNHFNTFKDFSFMDTVTDFGESAEDED